MIEYKSWPHHTVWPALDRKTNNQTIPKHHVYDLSPDCQHHVTQTCCKQSRPNQYYKTNSIITFVPPLLSERMTSMCERENITAAVPQKQ